MTTLTTPRPWPLLAAWCGTRDYAASAADHALAVETIGALDEAARTEIGRIVDEIDDDNNCLPAIERALDEWASRIEGGDTA